MRIQSSFTPPVHAMQRSNSSANFSKNVSFADLSSDASGMQQQQQQSSSTRSTRKQQRRRAATNNNDDDSGTDTDVPLHPAQVSIHSSLERLVDRIGEIKTAPWSVPPYSVRTEAESTALRRVAADLGMCVPRSNEENYSLLPKSFRPSELEPRSVLHSMLALIGGFSWSPLRKRNRGNQLGGNNLSVITRGGGTPSRNTGPENLSRLFDHFTAAALRVHVLRHRAVNSGHTIKVIAESAVLMESINQQINQEVESMSRHLSKEQIAELPIDRVAFRETMDAFLFERSIKDGANAAAAATAKYNNNGGNEKNNNKSSSGDAAATATAGAGNLSASFSAASFFGPVESGDTAEKSPTEQTINHAALLSAIEGHHQHQHHPRHRLNSGTTPSGAGSLAASPLDRTLGPYSVSGVSSSTLHNKGQFNAATVIDPDMPFELMPPEHRAAAYDSVFDSIDVRLAGEINWKIFFATLTQASLLPKLGGLVHHPRILDFSHWILPTKLREVLGNVHHVVTFSKGNAQVVVGHNAALVMMLPKLNSYGSSAKGTDVKSNNANGAKNSRGGNDDGNPNHDANEEKIESFFSSLRFLATFEGVKCFVNGVSTAMRAKQERPMRLPEILAKARGAHLANNQQQQQSARRRRKKQMRRLLSNNDDDDDDQEGSNSDSDDDDFDDDDENSYNYEEEDESFFRRRKALNNSNGNNNSASAGVSSSRSRRSASASSSRNDAGGGGKRGGRKKPPIAPGGSASLVHGDRLTALSNPKRHREPDPQIVQVLVVEAVNVIIVSATDGTVKLYHIAGSATLPNCELFFTVSIDNTVSAITPSWNYQTLYFGTRHGHLISIDFPHPQKNLTSNRLRVECMAARSSHHHHHNQQQSQAKQQPQQTASDQDEGSGDYPPAENNVNSSNTNSKKRTPSSAARSRVAPVNPLGRVLRPPAKSSRVPNTPYKSYVKVKSEEELMRDALRAVQVFDVTHKAQALPHTGIVSSIIHLEVEHAVLSCSYDHTIMLSNESDLQPLVQYCGHTSGVHKAVHSDDYNFFVSVAFDSRPLVWSVSTQPSRKPPMELYDPLKPHQGTIVDADYIPSSNLVLTLDDLGMVKFWDMRLIHSFETVMISKFQPSHMSSFSTESGSNVADHFRNGADVSMQNLMSMPLRFVGMSLLYEQASLSNPTETLRLFCYTQHHGACVCEWNLRLKERVVKNAAEDQPIIASFLLPPPSAAHSASGGVDSSLATSVTTTTAASDGAIESSASALAQVLANVTPTNYRTWDLSSGVIRDYFQHETHAAAGGISAGAMNHSRTVIALGCRDGSVFAHNAQSGTHIQSFRRLHKQPVQQIACFSYAPQFHLRRNAPRIMVMSLAQRHLHLVVLDANSDGGVVENAGQLATKQQEMAAPDSRTTNSPTRQRATSSAERRRQEQQKKKSGGGGAQLNSAMATTALEKGVWLQLLDDEEDDEAEALSLQYARHKGVAHRVRCFDVDDQVDLIAVGTSHAKIVGFAMSSTCASAALRIPIGSVYLPPPRRNASKKKQQQQQQQTASESNHHHTTDTDDQHDIQSKISSGDLDVILLKLLPGVGMGIAVTESSRMCLFALGCSPLGPRGDNATAAGTQNYFAAGTPAGSNASPFAASGIHHNNNNNNNSSSAANNIMSPETAGILLGDGDSPWSLTHLSASVAFESRKKRKLPNHFTPRACWHHATDRNFSLEGSQPLPTVIESPERLPHLLYVGDDKGFVTLYDLTPILSGVGESPTIVNRWVAHNDAVVSIFFLSCAAGLPLHRKPTTSSSSHQQQQQHHQQHPFGSNNNIQREAMVGTSGADQTVHGFSMAGALYFGALDLHQRLSILSAPAFVTDDHTRFSAREHDKLLREAAVHFVFMVKDTCSAMAEKLVAEHEKDLIERERFLAMLAGGHPHDQFVFEDLDSPSSTAGVNSKKKNDHDAEDEEEEEEEQQQQEHADESEDEADDDDSINNEKSDGFISGVYDDVKLELPAALQEFQAQQKAQQKLERKRQRHEEREAARRKQLEERREKRRLAHEERMKKRNNATKHLVAAEQWRDFAVKLVTEALRRVLLVPRAKNLPLEIVPWSRDPTTSDAALEIMESLRLAHFTEQQEEEEDEKNAAEISAALFGGKKQQQGRNDEQLLDEQQQNEDVADQQQKQHQPFSMTAPTPQPKYTFDMYGGGHNNDDDDDNNEGEKNVPSYDDAIKILQRDLFGGGGAAQSASLGNILSTQQQHHQRSGPTAHGVVVSNTTTMLGSRPPPAAAASTPECYRPAPGKRRPPSAGAASLGKGAVVSRWEKRQKWEKLCPKALRFEEFADPEVVEEERRRQFLVQQQLEQQHQKMVKDHVNGTPATPPQATPSAALLAPDQSFTFSETSDTEKRKEQQRQELLSMQNSRSKLSVSFSPTPARVSSFSQQQQQQQQSSSASASSPAGVPSGVAHLLTRPKMNAEAKLVLERAEWTRHVFQALEQSPVMSSPLEERNKKERNEGGRSVVVTKDTVPPGLERKQHQQQQHQHEAERSLVAELVSNPQSLIKPESRKLLAELAEIRSSTAAKAQQPLAVAGHRSMMTMMHTRVARGPAALSLRGALSPQLQSQPSPQPVVRK